MKNKPKYLKRLLFCPPDKLSGISEEEVRSQIIQKIQPNKTIGFAGYAKKEGIEWAINRKVIGGEDSISLPDILKDKELIEKKVISTLSKCEEMISLPDLYFFVLPTQDQFTKEKMEGSNGASIYKGVIHLYTNNAIEGWDNEIINTIAHETAHAISRTNFEWETILDTIIFEGVAEHFREETVGGGHDPWTQTLTKKESKSLLKELTEEDLLGKDEEGNFYYKLFHGTGKYPLWAGYSIGYMIIEEILKKKDITIVKLLKTKPEEILKIYNNL